MWPIFPQKDISLCFLFPPLTVPAHIKSNLKTDFEAPTHYYIGLVLESVIDSLIQKEGQLTSHKAAKANMTFKIIDICICKSTFKNRMFVKRILGRCCV
jgi:hypothetical protein